MNTDMDGMEESSITSNVNVNDRESFPSSHQVRCFTIFNRLISKCILKCFLIATKDMLSPRFNNIDEPPYITYNEQTDNDFSSPDIDTDNHAPFHTESKSMRETEDVVKTPSPNTIRRRRRRRRRSRSAKLSCEIDQSTPNSIVVRRHSHIASNEQFVHVGDVDEVEPINPMHHNQSQLQISQYSQSSSVHSEINSVNATANVIQNQFEITADDNPKDPNQPSHSGHVTQSCDIDLSVDNPEEGDCIRSNLNIYFIIKLFYLSFNFQWIRFRTNAYPSQMAQNWMSGYVSYKNGTILDVKVVDPRMGHEEIMIDTKVTECEILPFGQMEYLQVMRKLEEQDQSVHSALSDQSKNKKLPPIAPPQVSNRIVSPQVYGTCFNLSLQFYDFCV